MRRPVIALCLGAAVAVAGPHADKKAKPIELKPMIDKLVVFRDDLGSYYVAPATDAVFANLDEASKWVFYGDGKTMYQQRVVASSVTPGKHFEWGLWAPRVKNAYLATIQLDDTKLTLACTAKDHRQLTPLKADEAKAVLAKATFYPPLWQRQSKFLARDDDGVYYFVDQLTEEFGGNGDRVFVGLKGQMKELPLTNVVSDSAGEIYATRSGNLKIIAGKDGKAFWIKGGKKIELTILDTAVNRYLIYRDLGIYGQLGTVCEDV